MQSPVPNFFMIGSGMLILWVVENGLLPLTQPVAVNTGRCNSVVSDQYSVWRHLQWTRHQPRCSSQQTHSCMLGTRHIRNHHLLLLLSLTKRRQDTWSDAARWDAMIGHAAVDTEDVAARRTRCHWTVRQHWTSTARPRTIHDVSHCVQCPL